MSATLTAFKEQKQVDRLLKESVAGALAKCLPEGQEFSSEPVIHWVRKNTPGLHVTAQPGTYQHVWVVPTGQGEQNPVTQTSIGESRVLRGYTDGLAALVSLAHRPLYWSSHFVELISDDDWTLSEGEDWLSQWQSQIWVSPFTPPDFRRWVVTTSDLAAEILPCEVAPPKVEIDPENDDESWVTITANCSGDVESIVEAYERFTREFVRTIPAEARDYIRIELCVE